MAKCTSMNDEAVDQSLVAAIRAGDESAFERIFDRHKRRVARIAGRFIARPEKVDEIIQEVFAKVYFNLDDYSPDKGPGFVAWVSRIAINCAYDELRRMQRRPESSISEVTDDASGWLNAQMPLSGSANAESRVVTRDLANKLLARLGADDRLVLTLMIAEEMPVADIAAMTGWSVSKVKVRAHRARRSLRGMLADLI
jgi:RNA polymerase sigma-70 factor, ECF subfamily